MGRLESERNRDIAWFDVLNVARGAVDLGCEHDHTSPSRSDPVARPQWHVVDNEEASLGQSGYLLGKDQLPLDHASIQESHRSAGRHASDPVRSDTKTIEHGGSIQPGDGIGDSRDTKVHLAGIVLAKMPADHSTDRIDEFSASPVAFAALSPQPVTVANMAETNSMEIDLPESKVVAAGPAASFALNDADEISYIAGIDFGQKVVSTSYWGWQRKTHDYNPDQTRGFKWGNSESPSGGGTIHYYYDPGSNWNSAERAGFRACFDLWMAEANVTFVRVDNASAADVTIERGNDDSSYTKVTSDRATVGSVDLPQPTSAKMHFDTHRDFGFFGSAFNGDIFQRQGGYGADTMIHEMGHLLGLGHAGPYNTTVSPSTDQFGPLDTRLWSIMSYIDPDDKTAKFFRDYPVKRTDWGTSIDPVDGKSYGLSPNTPMLLDILVIQRLYGAPTSGPLVGGNNVYGFHCNIEGRAGYFFNFDINTSPVVTIWGTGINNTLDLSGWNTPSTINMDTGSFCSANRMNNNIFIACVIDHVVGGGGNDTIYGTRWDDVIDGGKGADRMNGGLGNDTYLVDSSGDTMRLDLHWMR